jgi:ATP-dependent protease HslVU (ClpYQ) peptidase subunit
MSCVVGLISNGSVVMGADSASVASEDLRLRADLKIGKVGPYLLGFAGSFRAGQLVLHAFKPPTPPTTGDLFPFMVTEFVDILEGTLDGGGSNKRGDGMEESPADIMVGINGRLFVIGADYQVEEATTPFMAIGSGARVALGALHTSITQLEMLDTLDAELIVQQALEAAEFYTNSVRAPFHIETLNVLRLAVL